MSAPWICLMYHDVSPERPRVSGGPGFFSVSAASFDEQLGWIADAGLAGSTITGLLAGGAAGRVAISFDDGDAGQYANAFRLLAARRMTGTFFITTSWVGTPGYVTWDQLREMKAGGMELQSHSHSHPFLSELAEPPLREELRTSRRLLDEQLGQRTTMLALPGGDWPRRALRGVMAAEGFDTVATSRWGVNPAPGRSGLSVVRRCTVRGAPSRDEFQRVLDADPLLGWQRRLRESTLGAVRSALGPTRYARLRRSALDRAGGATSGDIA